MLNGEVYLAPAGKEFLIRKDVLNLVNLLVIFHLSETFSEVAHNF